MRATRRKGCTISATSICNNGCLKDGNFISSNVFTFAVARINRKAGVCAVSTNNNGFFNCSNAASIVRLNLTSTASRGTR